MPEFVTVCRSLWSSLASFFASFCSTVWSCIVGIILFLPRIVHDLAVPPDDEDDHSGGHLLTWEFGQAYRHLPSLLRSLAFKTRNLDDQLRESMLRGNLRRTFGQFDLVMVGIGLVVGSGVFYKGGIVQATSTGSAVFLGYILDFVPIFLTAVIFAEFTVEYPVAGGAFTWTMSTLGEFPALMTLGLLSVNYVLTIAAVARVLTASIALLFNTRLTNFVIDIGGTELDFVSFAITLFLTLVLCVGTRESGFMLAAANITGLIFILFVGITGFTQAQPEVFDSDWLPYGSSGLFQSLPVLLFSYIGFDAIAYSIEEARDVKDAPPAYMWTVVVSMLLYVFMALSLSLMVTSDQLNQCTNTIAELLPCSSPNSVKAYYQAFVFAFDMVGLNWMQYVFAVGSIICIVTTLLVALFVSARLIMVGAREWMLPPVLATVSTRTKTPIIAQVLVGSISSILALFTGYSKLSDLASFAYLCIMLVVCNAYLGRRYYPDVKLRYSQYGTVEATAARFMGLTNKNSGVTPGTSGPVRSNTSMSDFQETPRAMRLLKDSNGTNKINGPDHIGGSYSNGATFARMEKVAANPDDDAHLEHNVPRLWRLLNIQMTKIMHRTMVWAFLIVINTTSICVGVLYRVFPKSSAAIWALIPWGVSVCAMWLLCPVEYEPKTWKIHRYFLPFVPSVAILGIVFVSSNLATFDYVYSLVIAGAVALFYVFFSMPLSYIRKYSASSKGDGVRVIELVYKHGNWISVDQMTTRVAHFDDLHSSESPGVNSLPGSIVDRNRTISQTLSKIGSMTLNTMHGMPSGTISQTGSGISPVLSGRFSSDWSDGLSLANSLGSVELYQKNTTKRANNPKLETITDNSIRSSDTRSNKTPSRGISRVISHAETAKKDEGQPDDRGEFGR